VLVDTHCHLYIKYSEEELPAILERAWQVGLERILIPGIDLASSRRAVELSEQDARLYAAVGVHPNESLTWTEQSRRELGELARHPRVVAIGEIGLDYYRTYAPHEQQKRALIEQLELAAEMGLPVAIHNRNAWDELWPILSGWQAELERQGADLAERPGVLHAYDGGREQAEAALKQHFRLGFGGPVTYKNALERQKLAAELLLEMIVIETDAPYLTPQQHRGQRNEPAYVRFVAEKIAELREQDPDFIAKATSQNAARLFRWDHHA
jgi:TatD DNase family protein